MPTSKTKRNVIAAIIVIVCLVPLLARAIFEVWHGRSGESYKNVYGLDIQWGSLLITVAAFALAFVIALIARAVSAWREKRGL